MSSSTIVYITVAVRKGQQTDMPMTLRTAQSARRRSRAARSTPADAEHAAARRRCARSRSRTWASPASITIARSGRASPKSSSAWAKRRPRLPPSPQRSSAAARRCSSRARRRRRSTPCARVVPAGDVSRRGARSSRLRQQDVAPGKGTILIVARRHLRPAGRRRSGAHRRADGQRRRSALRRRRRRPPPSARRTRAASPPRASSSSSPGMEGALPSVVAGLVSVPVIAVPTSDRLRRQLRRHRRAARHAEQLRVRRVGRQHRQRLRRRQHRQPDQSLVSAIGDSG